MICAAALTAATILAACEAETPPPSNEPEPECVESADCEARACASNQCVGGGCVWSAVSGEACDADGGLGVCNNGACVGVWPCATAADCPYRECADPFCAKERCEWSRRPDDWTCVTDAGLSGVCMGGVCIR